MQKGPRRQPAAAIRSKSGLSQRAFAQSIGVAPGTRHGWEQGRRIPAGPAGGLRALIDRTAGDRAAATGGEGAATERLYQLQRSMLRSALADPSSLMSPFPKRRKI